MSIHSISLKTIKYFREKATTLWLTKEVLDGSLGWSVSKCDVNKILEVFSSLKLSEEMKLWGFHYREERSGEGCILSLPKNLDPNSLLQNFENSSFQEYAPNLFLSAESSPNNYMLSSLFQRECQEFGAFGHGINWMDHHIIDSLDGYSQLYDDVRIPIHLSDWNWLETIPSSLQFNIVEKDNQFIVTFFTIIERQRRVIKKHIDVYSKGKFAPTSRTIVMALGK